MVKWVLIVVMSQNGYVHIPMLDEATCEAFRPHVAESIDGKEVPLVSYCVEDKRKAR